MADEATTGGASRFIPGPPVNQCAPWHYYWCDGHQDWHHHQEDAVAAIEASFGTAG